MNALEVGTLWHSSVLVCLLSLEYVDHLQENLTWPCTINKNGRDNIPCWKKDTGTSSLFILTVTALASIFRVRKPQRVILAGPSQDVVSK